MKRRKFTRLLPGEALCPFLVPLDATHELLALHDSFQSLKDFVSHIRLDQVTVRTRAQGGFYNLRIGVLGQKKDVRFRSKLANLSSSCDPIQFRKATNTTAASPAIVKMCFLMADLLFAMIAA